MIKVCTKCGLAKSEIEFYKVKDRCIAACKECTKASVKKYATVNNLIVNEKKKKYTDANREWKSAYDKKWRSNNKEYKSLKDKEYRKNNPERCKNNHRNLYLKTKDRWNELAKKRFSKRFEDEKILNQLKTSSKKYHEKSRDNLTDVYVSRAIWSNLKGEVPIKLIQENRELVNLKRFEIQFNRKLKAKKNEASKQ